MTDGQAPAAPRPAEPRGAGLGWTLVQIGIGLCALLGRGLGLLLYWPWAHRRATAAFRRELKRAGLPAAGIARLTATYAAAGNPWLLLRLALGNRHRRRGTMPAGFERWAEATGDPDGRGPRVARTMSRER